MDPPRYLFRAFSPGSDGINDSSGFRSMAAANGYGHDTHEQLPDNLASKMLFEHVTYQSWRARLDDVFISFTTSLFFAIIHGLRKVEKQPFCTTLQNCLIAIIDTSFFPKGTLSWTPDLLDRYGLYEAQDRKLRRSYHSSEYLADDEVLITRPGASTQVSLQTLIDQGSVLRLWPELESPTCKGKLILALKFIREEWYQHEKPIKDWTIEGARRFAQCFGGKWYLPVMVWVIASRLRSGNDARLVEEFATGFNGKVDGHYLYPNKAVQPPDDVRELVEWAKLMRQVEQAQQTQLKSAESEAGDDLDQLLSELSLANKGKDAGEEGAGKE